MNKEEYIIVRIFGGMAINFAVVCIWKKLIN